MDLFTVIDDALAIVRYPKGVLKQVKLYHRKTRVFIPHSGGFVQVRGKETGSEMYYTSHPDIRLVEYQAEGMETVRELGTSHLRWTKGSK